ncbi:MAG: hypothetical protein ACK5WM_14750 [Rhodospirillales bacterium]
MAPSDGSFTDVVRRTAPVPAWGAWAVDGDVLLARALLGAFVLIPLAWACGFLWPPINHDVAANLDMARRWLAGERLYRDVIDVNTPLVFLVYAVPEGLARLFGGSGAIWMVACVIAGVTASSIVSHRILRRLFAGEQSVGLVLLSLLAPFLLVVLPPDNSFGQREHLMTILALPYVFAAVARADGRPLPAGLLLAVGVAAGIGFSLKPHFVAIPILVEGYVLTRRSLRVGLADPLPWGIAAAVTGHVLFALAITPDYVTFVLPFVFKYYTQIGGSGAVEVLTGRYILPSLLACAFAALLAPAVLRPRVAPIAALFAFGAALAAVAQGKGWAYQSYPVMAMAAVAMAATVAGLVDRHVPLSGRAGHRAAVFIASAVLGLFYVQDALMDQPFRKQQQYVGSPLQQLTQAVQKNATNGRVLVMSPGIFPHYPMINYAGVEMVMPFQTMWPLQGIYANCLPGGHLYNEPAEMSEGERFVFESIAGAFATKQPALLIVDRVPGIPRCRTEVFSYLEYFLRHPDFAAAFENYEPFIEKERYVVYKRN